MSTGTCYMPAIVDKSVFGQPPLWRLSIDPGACRAEIHFEPELIYFCKNRRVIAELGSCFEKALHDLNIQGTTAWIGYEPPPPPEDDLDDLDDTLDPAQLVIAAAILQSIALIYGAAMTLSAFGLLKTGTAGDR